MSYIDYGQATVGAKEVIALMRALQGVAADLVTVKAWIEQIGVASLEASADFLVGPGQDQDFNDTFVQIADAFATFYGDGSSGTNAEKIARLARG